MRIDCGQKSVTRKLKEDRFAVPVTDNHSGDNVNGFFINGHNAACSYVGYQIIDFKLAQPVKTGNKEKR